MFEFFERELRKEIKSDKNDKEKINLVETLIAASNVWEKIYGGNQFSKSEKSPETARGEIISLSISKETQKLIEYMEKDGYVVYETQGKTPISLRKEGMEYYVLDSGLENLTSKPALLAFKKDPSQFYLKGSYSISFEDQIKLIAEEQRKIDKQYSSSDLLVKLGYFSEWSELAFMHFKATGVRLHGKDYGYNWTWTDTYESNQPGAYRAIAGFWDEIYGFNGRFWNPDDISPRLRVAPLYLISPQR